MRKFNLRLVKEITSRSAKETRAKFQSAKDIAQEICFLMTRSGFFGFFFPSIFFSTCEEYDLESPFIHISYTGHVAFVVLVLKHTS